MIINNNKTNAQNHRAPDTENIQPLSKAKPDSLSILPFGGVGEIGMNLSAYQFNGKYLIVDVGIGFDSSLPSQNKVIIPDISALKGCDVVGIVITHGHDDHIGAIPHIWPTFKCPIYATDLAAALIKKKSADNPEIADAINVIERGEWVELGPFKFKMIGITHSIPSSNSVAIRAGDVTVLHTGDWKIDINPIIGERTDEEGFKELGKEGVTALICDSTNVFKSEPDQNKRSISSIEPDLEKILQQNEGKRVFITCIATNVAIMKICYEIAKRNGRELCLVGRSLMKIHEAAQETGYWNKEDFVLLDEEGAKKQRGSVLYLCTGSQGEPGSVIERLSRRDKHCRVFTDAGDVAVFAGRVILGNERPVNQIRNRFAEMGITSILPSEEYHIHSSGHPVREDLATMYRWVNPACIVPVHGEALHVIEHEKFAKQQGFRTSSLRNGYESVISKDGVKKIGEFYTACKAVDGKGVYLDTNGPAMKEKFRLQSGIIVIIISGKVIRVDARGLFDNAKEFSEKVIEMVRGRLSHLEKDKKISYHQTLEDISNYIGSWVYDTQARKPMVRVHIMGRYRKPSQDGVAPLEEEDTENPQKKQKLE